MDAQIKLVTLLWVKVGVTPLVAEDVVVHTVGTQLLGDRHAETLAHIGLEHPVARGIVDTCRPSETRKPSVHVGRAFLEDRVTSSRWCEKPVMIAADVGVGIVQTDASVQLQTLVDGISVHRVGTDAGRLEVGNNKTPAAPSVVLILTVQSRAQLLAFAQIHRQSQISRQRILHETALQRAVWFRHVAVTYGLTQFLAMVVLPGKVGLHV